MKVNSKKTCVKWLFCCVPILLGFISCGNDALRVDTSTVRHLNINKFMGRWYEIARYDHRFERGMTHVVADYSIMDDGKIKVVNTGVKDGKIKEIEGKAKRLNPLHYPGRLRVSFFLWFYSDYYILSVDKDYQYAVIGSSSDDYLWILSRKPELPESTLNKLLSDLKRRGYDVDKLLWVEQS
jgi:lipocalin